MTATLAQSQAILKVRYPDGRLPKAVYRTFKYTSMVKKREDFRGSSRVVALQNENPQGSSADFQTALGSMQQGTYNNFSVTRVEHFGIARIKGQALRATEGDEGALVDLWKNETDGISMTETQNLEIYSFGNGSGTKGQFAVGQTFATTTVTLRNTTDVLKFALNERIQVVSDATLSPTLRTGGPARITGIDRKNGTLTLAQNWNSYFQSLNAADYLVRAGDFASAGTAAVIMGIQGWIVGGTSPGTLFGLNRNSDPVRLAGQVHDCTGNSIEESIIDASSEVAEQGAPQPEDGWIHPRTLAKFKKALGGKVEYERAAIKSLTAGVSFRAIIIEGDDGDIKLMSSPFVSLTDLPLLNGESFTLDTIGPAPQLLDFDGPNFLRVASDDAYECRFGMYGNHYTNMPFGSIILQNVGL